MFEMIWAGVNDSLFSFHDDTHPFSNERVAV